MDSDAYRFGQFVSESILLLTALVLVVWGFQQRQVYEKRQEGTVKLTIGASLMAAFGLVIVVSMLVGPKADTDDEQGTTEVASSEADVALDGANRYLRGIDQVRATGSVDNERFDITFVDDEDAVGTLMSGDVKLRFIHVDGEMYIKPSDTLWKMTPNPRTAKEFVDGRWIRVDTHDQRFATLGALGDRGLFLEPLSGVLDYDYKEGAPRTFHGVECIAVRPSFGGVLYLAREPARLMRVEDGKGFVADLDYDAPAVTAEAPSAVIEGSEVFPPDPKT